MVVSSGSSSASRHEPFAKPLRTLICVVHVPVLLLFLLLFLTPFLHTYSLIRFVGIVDLRTYVVSKFIIVFLLHGDGN